MMPNNHSDSTDDVPFPLTNDPGAALLPYVTRLRALLTNLQLRRTLAREVYERGGKHPKDAERYNLLGTVIESIETLFPEAHGQ